MKLEDNLRACWEAQPGRFPSAHSHQALPVTREDACGADVVGGRPFPCITGEKTSKRANEL